MSLFKDGKYHDPLHMGWNKISFRYGNKEYVLNKSMLDQQNCWENLEEIKEVNWLKLVFCEMLTEAQTREVKKDLFKDIEQCDFKLQSLYGFPENANFHRFWDYPGCLCPVLDNQDNYGTEYKSIMIDCPLHGE